MLNFSSVMVGTMQLGVMRDFYEAVFQKAPEMSEEDFKGWSVGKTFFSIGTHSQADGQAKDPARIILNFETDEVKEEFERIKEIDGVKVIKEPYDMGGAWIATLADPDGNLFQLMTPWKPAE